MASCKFVTNTLKSWGLRVDEDFSAFVPAGASHLNDKSNSSETRTTWECMTKQTSCRVRRRSSLLCFKMKILSLNSYDPDRTYSLKEFEKMNDFLKTHEVQINHTPISHFDRDYKGRLIPMPQTPIQKEVAVGEIFRQLANWNIQTRQNGAATTSQGGFNFGEGIRAPDVSFTPSDIYRGLDQSQLATFQGHPFSPTFAVEVENLSETRKLNELTDKFKTTYFPAGVELGWIIDPINENVYVLKRDRDNLVRRRHHAWYDRDGNPTVLDGRHVLPGFQLQLWEIGEAISQVRLFYYYFCHAIALIRTGHRNLLSQNLRATTKKPLARNVLKPFMTHTSLSSTLKINMHVECAGDPRKVRLHPLCVVCVLTFDFCIVLPISSIQTL